VLPPDYRSTRSFFSRDLLYLTGLEIHSICRNDWLGIFPTTARLKHSNAKDEIIDNQRHEIRNFVAIYWILARKLIKRYG